MTAACRNGCVIVVFLLFGCKSSNGAEYVGDQCLPQELPSGPMGSGFLPSETYTTEADGCHGYPCLVDRLDNGSEGRALADPNVLCDGDDPEAGCVTPEQVEQHVHCSCECDGPGDRDKYCECPDGFVCRQVFTPREDGLRNGPRSYCVKPH